MPLRNNLGREMEQRWGKKGQVSGSELSERCEVCR